MTIKLQNKDFYNHLVPNALRTISNERLPFKSAYKITKICKAFDKQMQELGTLFEETVTKKHFVYEDGKPKPLKDAKGEIIANEFELIDNTDAGKEAHAQAIQEFMEQEVVISEKPIKEADISTLQIPPNVLRGLDKFLDLPY